MKSRTSVRLALALWLAITAGLCLAAAIVGADDGGPLDLREYDWRAAGMAALAGLLGGLLQTVLQLARQGALVIDVLKQSRQDLVFALGGGLVLHVVVEGLSSMGWITVPRDMRVLLFAGVGYSRGAWMAWVHGSASDAAARTRRMIREGNPPSDKLPSAVMPLEDPKP